MEPVDVIASGYEWICPECDSANSEIEFEDKYHCSYCGVEVQTNFPEHCWGN